MRTGRPKLCEWWLALGAGLGLLRPPAVHVRAGSAIRQHLPALCPYRGLHPPRHRNSAPQRLSAGEQRLGLVGCYLRLARPADRRWVGRMVGAADCVLCPRVLCAAAQGDGVTVVSRKDVCSWDLYRAALPNRQAWPPCPLLNHCAPASSTSSVALTSLPPC